jgi:hypothetical protein
MDPTPNYYKTKRTFLLFVAALLLAIFAGFNITGGQERISVLPFQLTHPELLTHILFIAVLFYLFQFSLQWAAQISEVQKNTFHRIDFIATTTISVISMLCYVGWLVAPYVEEITTPNAKFWLGIVTGALAGLVSSLIAGFASERIASALGRTLKRKEASDDERLMRLLKSKSWILDYNPIVPGREKEIVFEDDGLIGEGLNNNENKWRVRNGLLEIINSDGRVFSRFSYDESEKKLFHTNDPDTLSIRSQIIHPK